MIEFLFNNISNTESIGGVSLVIEEAPFYCKVSGEIASRVPRLDKMYIQDKKYTASFRLQNCSMGEDSITTFEGDGWIKETPNTPLNLELGDPLIKTTKEVVLRKIGVVLPLKNNLKNITQMTFKEKMECIGRNQRFLANCYGNLIKVFGTPETVLSTEVLKGASLGSKSTFMPREELKYFFKKPFYVTHEMFGRGNGDISLFDTFEWGTVMFLTRRYDKGNQSWRATLVQL